jgi:hypothetical protein
VAGDDERAAAEELDDDNADAVALARAEELAGGAVPPRTQAEVFRSARAALP